MNIRKIPTPRWRRRSALPVGVLAALLASVLLSGAPATAQSVSPRPILDVTAYTIDATIHPKAHTLGDGQVLTVRAGELLVIPANMPHAAVALEDTLDLDVFAPPRADWIAGTDAYLKG